MKALKIYDEGKGFFVQSDVKNWPGLRLKCKSNTDSHYPIGLIASTLRVVSASLVLSLILCKFLSFSFNSILNIRIQTKQPITNTIFGNWLYKWCLDPYIKNGGQFLPLLLFSMTTNKKEALL